MREIKFRAKSVYTGEWEYGNFIHSKRFEGCSNEFRIHNKAMGWESDVIPETVGQFTGLFDKTGVDIFEGDIIRKHNNRNGIEKIEDYVVVFDFGGFCLKTIKDNDVHNKGALISFGNLENGNLRKEEVIGNIHDNPEMLS